MSNEPTQDKNQPSAAAPSSPPTTSTPTVGLEEPELESGVTLRPHVYDGIQEYDQKLPNWWLFTFYFAIVWFVVYWVLYYQTDLLATDADRLDRRISFIEDVKARQLESLLSDLNSEVLWDMSENKAVVAAGEKTYQTTCVACHAPDLTAHLGDVKLPGLPLHDTEWKYGGDPMQVFGIVANGSPDKLAGMQAWEPQLGPKRVAEIVAYVMSHHRRPADGESAPPPTAPIAAPAPAGS